MKLHALPVLAILMLGCPVDPPVPPPNPPPDTNLCAAMCNHLKKLGCEEGKPVYNNDQPGPKDIPNQSCADNCTELQTKGFFVNPKCVMTVTTCSQIEAVRPKDCTPK
jgi:hypothetical protein